jgi:gliding motility-associated-like protein
MATCPVQPGQLYLAAPWDTLNASADLFSSCATAAGNCQSVNVPENFAGTVTAINGNSYAGFMAYSTLSSNYREYIQSPLIQPLQAGEIYKVSARLRKASNCTHAVATIGMTLSSGALTQTGTSPLGFVPLVENQGVLNVSNQWVTLEGFIIAFGGENNITIGNFRDDNTSGAVPVGTSGNPCSIQGAYYYIDEVSVVHIVETLTISGPQVTCPGVPVTLTGMTNTIGWWSTQSNPQTPLSNLALLTVSPQTTTTYYYNGILTQASITIEVIDPPVINLGHNATICEGNSVTLDAYNPNSTYQWTTGATTSSITVNSTGIYMVSVHNGGCANRDTFYLTVLAAPEVKFQEGLIVCPLTYQSITLDAGSDGAAYQWMPGNQTSSSISVTQGGIYSVIKEYANGCTRTAEAEIKEVCEPLLFVPNAFTPNGDGINDRLVIEASGVESYSQRIFNRWGGLIYESGSQPWDGKNAPEGLYLHQTIFTYTDAEGKLRNRKIHGTVVLIR